jgi:hypothetical protein
MVDQSRLFFWIISHRTDIVDAYSKGKISDQQYGNLSTEISLLYKEIYNKKIESLDGFWDKENNNAELMENIKNDILDALFKRKDRQLHYSLLKEKVQLMRIIESLFSK